MFKNTISQSCTILKLKLLPFPYRHITSSAQCNLVEAAPPTKRLSLFLILNGDWLCDLH